MGVFDFLTKRKGNKNPAYLETGTYQMPKFPTQKDEDYLRDAYNKVVWVYSCVSMISSCVSSIPWELYRINKINGNEKQITEHPILTMLNQKVNPNMTSKDFFDLWATYLAIQGKFFATFNNTAIPTQLYPLYSHKVKPIPSRDRFIAGFEYRISSETENYKDTEVLWSKFNDPLDFYEGLSPIRAMARTIDTENEAVDWNKSQLQNQAVPAGAITVQNPSPTIVETLRQEWLKRYAGAKNSRVPLVLNADKASYTQFGLSPVDMDFLEQRKLSRVEICSGFGIPSQVVGDPSGQTYANYEEADRAMWKNTIIPKYLDHMKDKLNLTIAKKYNENLEIRYCLDDVQSLQENINETAERARQNFKFGIITQNEARKENGFEDTEDGDKFIFDIQGNIADDKPNKEEEKSQKKKSSLSEEDEVYWKAFEAEREPFDASFEKEVNKLFKLEADMIRGKDYEVALKKSKKMWQETFAKQYIKIIKHFGNKTINDLSKMKQDEMLNLYDVYISKYIAESVAEKIEFIQETTKNDIKSIIALGIEQGYSIVKISELIREQYKKYSQARATTIARTEVVAASNFGSLAGAIQAEEQLGIRVNKIWMVTADGRERDWHRVAGFTHAPIPLKDTFIVKGERLLMPGDSSHGASADNLVNCRCTQGYKRKEEE